MSIEVADLFPLAPIQEGLLFHALNEVGTGMYVEQAAWWLEGPLPVDRLEAAWQATVDRHAALRTGFAWEGLDRPLQVVHRSVPFRIRVVDGVPADQVEAFLHEDRMQGFDLRRPPLLRVTVLRDAPNRHVLVWTFHHIVLDGWSWGPLLSNVFAAFTALGDGGAPIPSEPSPSIRPYVEWLEQVDTTASETYWRRVLDGASTCPLDLGCVPAGHSDGAVDLRVELSDMLSEGIRQRARELRVTPNVIVQAAFATVLSRYLGSDDVVFGRTLSMRLPTLPDADRMLGPLVNTIPTRVRVPTDGTPFDTWVRDLQQAQAADWEHAHVPLPRIRRAAGISGTHPLFDVLFVFENRPGGPSVADELAACGLRLVEDRFHQRLNYPFCLVVVPEERFLLSFVHEQGVFPSDAVERMAGHLVTLLEDVVRDVGAPVSVRSLVDHDEEAALAQQEGPTRDVHAGPAIHELVAQAAAHRPHADAVVCGDDRLSFEELEVRANRLAHHLRRVGVGPEAFVGVLTPPSTDAVVALLAVLKAGGAYVPLDPEYPRRRLATMLADAGARLLVTVGEEADSLALDDTLPVVRLDSPATAELVAACPADVPTVDVDPDNAAYVIYTSGSTGRPKGVVVSHGAVVALLAATRPFFGFGPDDTWVLFHSLSFDFSVWEVWGALCHGGRLVVVPRSVARSPADLVHVLAAQRVTVLNQTPTAFAGTARAFREASPELVDRLALRHVVFGGEPLRASHLADWLSWPNRPAAALVNMYGITETTVHVTVHHVADEELAGEPSIGRPIDHTAVRLLDARLRRVPFGVSGELFVSGPGCARGYHGSPRLTAERFLPDPFSTRPGARMYRSGDLGRRRSDGVIDHLGRADQQAKIRGYRIEPGDVEAALVDHPDVRGAAVVVRTDSGHPRLVGYVVADPASGTTPAALRNHLAERLPDHMVPHALVLLEALPLTPSGKLDRSALPSPDPEVGVTREYRAPRDDAEEVLAAIWADVLGVSRVGVHDNFFELGGDSILSIRVAALAADRDMALPPGALFDAPTVAELAALVAKAGGDADGPRPPMPFSLLEGGAEGVPADVEDAYPMTALQAGMLFHSSFRPGAGTYHDLFRYRIRGLWDEDALRSALDAMAERHPVLRTTFDLHRHGYPVQLVHREARPTVEVGDARPGTRRRAERRRHERMFEEEPRRAFEWEKEPPVRVFVHRVADDAFDVSLAFHHAVLDGWSVVLFYTELARRYAGLLDGTSAASPPLRTSYARFVELERAAATSLLARSFWERHLEHAAPCLVRAWSAGDAAGRGSSGRYVVELEEDLVARLRVTAARLHVPVKSVFLAAHLATVAGTLDRDAVTTGVVTHGRPEEPDGDRLLGLFLNTVPLHLQVAGCSWRDLVLRTSAAERASFPHRRYPLAEIVRARGELFDWLFNYTNFHLLGDQPEGGRVSVAPVDGFESTNFPLMTAIALDGADGSVLLSYDPAAVDPAQVEAAGKVYLGCLSDLVANLRGVVRGGQA